MVAVAGGKGLCGRMGTGCIMGLFAVSRKGVLVRTSTNASSAATSSVVTVKTFDLPASFLCILLEIWSELVAQSVLHDAVVDHDIRGRRSDILDGSLKICDDGLRQEGIVR